jgi:glucosamine kinase
VISGNEVSQEFVIGIDGGGTYCRAMLQDINGNILGTGEAGPANIMSNATQALTSIIQASEHAIEKSTVNVALSDIAVAAGLAGANIPQAKSTFLSLPMPFARLEVMSDLHAACLGAHNGQDGAMIICGTGSAGTVYQKGHFADKGGYGLNVGDNASAAWLGQSAIRHTLLAFDNIESRGMLFKRLTSHFDVTDPQTLIQEISQFTAESYGQLAPIVVESFSQGCESAKKLLEQGGDYLSKLGKALHREAGQALPICFVGGLSNVYRPFLSSDVSSVLCDAAKPAQQGAIDFLKQTNSL